MIKFASVPLLGIFFAINIPSGIWINKTKKENKKLRVRDNINSEDEESCLNHSKPTQI